jgi:hypothetical protein
VPEWVEVESQEELDKALLQPAAIPVCKGDGQFVVGGTAIVRAGDSVAVDASQSATVEAWGSATVIASDTATVAAWESTRVEARGSVTVEAWDRARVEAWDSVTVRLWGWATVRAWGSVSVEAEHWTSVDARDRASVEAWDWVTVTALDSASVKAWGEAVVKASDSASVKAWGSVTVDAMGSSSLEAWDSTTVRAGGSASVRAWGSAMVRTRGSASVEASKHVGVTSHHPSSKITGGVVTNIPRITTAGEWCEFYGVAVRDGVATLFKAVGADFRSHYGMSYEPGSQPQAPDWDGGAKECGGGLHFSPNPSLALQWAPRATRYVACPVRVEDIVVNASMIHSGKIKAKGVCAPVYEVDEEGEPV